jgi:SNF2 family DNA or RNA helicase
MPGIFVDLLDDDLVEVKMPYHDSYLQRIRKVDGARWNESQEAWVLPIESAEDLDIMFEGELIYKYPRHELIEDIDPPPVPPIFKKVKEKAIKGLKLKPRDFQLFGANFLSLSLDRIGVGLLGDLMGTGKTFMSIMTAMQKKQEKRVEKVLVVVLAPTRTQWMEEIEKFTNEKGVLFADFKAKYRQQNGKKYVAETIDDQKKSVVDYYKHSEDMFMVMSYQTLQQNADLIEQCGFDMVIFDEAHNIKNKDSKTNKAAKKLIKPRTKRHKKGYNKGIKYTLLVTGTPVMNYPDDLFGLVGMANEDIFGKWRDFRKEYLTLNEYKDVIGYRHLDTFVEKIQEFYIRRTDKEIGLSLPKIVEEDKWIDPHPKQVKLDKELKTYQKELIQEKMDLLRSGKKAEAQEMEDRLKGILGFRIQAACHPNLFQMSANEKIRNRYKDYVVKDELDIPKFKQCLEMVEEIVENGHKVVVFVESRRMTVLLHKHISKFTRAVRYIGGLNDKKRDRRKKKFNNDPSCRVMIANGAGSTGLNLQAGKYLINYDLPHNPAIWNQRKYRIRRLDSTHDRVFIYNLVNRGVVDEEMRTRLDQKQASFDATLENSDATTKFHQSKIKKKKKPKVKTRKRTKVSDNDAW